MELVWFSWGGGGGGAGSVGGDASPPTAVLLLVVLDFKHLQHSVIQIKVVGFPGPGGLDTGFAGGGGGGPANSNGTLTVGLGPWLVVLVDHMLVLEAVQLDPPGPTLIPLY